MGRTNLQTLKLFVVIWAFFYCLVLILVAYADCRDEITRINQTSVQVPRRLKVAERPFKIMTVSAYNAGDPNQCDENPCQSASGADICYLLAHGVNVCALNGVKFWTKLEVENLGTCLVLDRTNTKYTGRIDWAMPKEQRQAALAFGLKQLKVYINK